MFDPGEIVLRENGFVLKPLAVSDVEGLWGAASEDQSHYQYTQVPKSREMAKTYITSALTGLREGWRYPFAILAGDRIVGTTSYFDYECWQWPKHTGKPTSTAPDTCEVGYTWLANSAQRTGCNTACKFLLLRYAFEEWGVCRITIRTDERNARSRHAIERVGGRFEGIRRADKPGWDGTIRNSAFYSIIDSEWPDLKSQLVQLTRRS